MYHDGPAEIMPDGAPALDPPLKVCAHCREAKPRADFWANRHASDGLSSWCRACYRERDRSKWAKAARERERERARMRAAEVRRRRMAEPEPDAEPDPRPLLPTRHDDDGPDPDEPEGETPPPEEIARMCAKIRKRWTLDDWRTRWR